MNQKTELVFGVRWAINTGEARFGMFKDFMNSIDPILYEDKMPFRSFEVIVIGSNWIFDTQTWLLKIDDEELAMKIILTKPDWLTLNRI